MKRLYSLLSVVFFFLIVVLAFYIWHPQYQQNVHQQIKLEETKEVAEEAEANLQKLKEAESKLADYEELILQLEHTLPRISSLALVDLDIFLRQTSRRYGLLLTGINISPEANKADISLSLSGSYEEFTSFISYLNKNYKIFKIRDINLASAEDPEALEEPYDIWSFRVDLTTYYLPAVASPEEAEVSFEEIY